MRDDFIKSVKQVLSLRVALLCSNPDCRRLTVGPNSSTNKSTNIGVAAHITAASPGGHRYDCNMNSKERCSIANGIWLCQTCAKLIDSDEPKYTIELLVRWKSDAENYADSQLNGRTESHNKYQKIFEHIPDLVNEMADDINNDPLAREFVLLGKNWAYADKRNVLRYFYEEHEDLEKKIRALENVGLIKDIAFNDTKRYVFTEEFVDLLTNYNYFKNQCRVNWEHQNNQLP